MVVNVKGGGRLLLGWLLVVVVALIMMMELSAQQEAAHHHQEAHTCTSRRDEITDTSPTNRGINSLNRIQNHDLHRTKDTIAFFVLLDHFVRDIVNITSFHHYSSSNEPTLIVNALCGTL